MLLLLKTFSCGFLLTILGSSHVAFFFFVLSGRRSASVFAGRPCLRLLSGGGCSNAPVLLYWQSKTDSIFLVNKKIEDVHKVWVNINDGFVLRWIFSLVSLSYFKFTYVADIHLWFCSCRPNFGLASYIVWIVEYFKLLSFRLLFC